jgi:putative nucleotide binding protein
MEEYAYILDYLPMGTPAGGYARKEPVCYALGEEEFKLFELVPKANAIINMGERVYIGKDPALRTHIDHVKRRIGPSDLTGNAQSELEYAVNDIVLAHQLRFVKFYNEAQAISMRKHLLEELPGLGKKTMMAILDERKKGPFKDFTDLSTRVPLCKNPEKYITDRIVLEVSDPERRHYLFVSK